MRKSYLTIAALTVLSSTAFAGKLTYVGKSAYSPSGSEPCTLYVESDGSDRLTNLNLVGVGKKWDISRGNRVEVIDISIARQIDEFTNRYYVKRTRKGELIGKSLYRTTNPESLQGIVASRQRVKTRGYTRNFIDVAVSHSFASLDGGIGALRVEQSSTKCIDLKLVAETF